MTADDVADDVAAGLAHERTALAWTRTALAYLVTGAVGARALPSTASLPARVGVIGLAIGLGSMAAVWSYARFRVDESASGVGPGAAHLAVALLSLGTLLLAGAGIVTDLP